MSTCNRSIPGTSARCALPLGHDPGRACEPGVVTIGDRFAAIQVLAVLRPQRRIVDEARAMLDAVVADLDLSEYQPRKPNRAGRRRGRK